MRLPHNEHQAPQKRTPTRRQYEKTASTLVLNGGGEIPPWGFLTTFWLSLHWGPESHYLCSSHNPRRLCPQEQGKNLKPRPQRIMFRNKFPINIFHNAKSGNTFKDTSHHEKESTEAIDIKSKPTKQQTHKEIKFRITKQNI